MNRWEWNCSASDPDLRVPQMAKAGSPLVRRLGEPPEQARSDAFHASST
ncbi:hypothetical protein JI739_20065 [Ramlibacter sp. AW1]|uniref:Uncharacterized protein n=1 Tax=Ramlibacter aurantiacus TaxID=2801330 RepID=A0A936ZWZ5_9BURK|nr:hypothetical protein [Ramlibacter aurantiacus]MBL0422640.1 hypothetical protein [Ramlibacter aurantiacus]